jgi:hypothetical protein
MTLIPLLSVIMLSVVMPNVVAPREADFFGPIGRSIMMNCLFLPPPASLFRFFLSWLTRIKKNLFINLFFGFSFNVFSFEINHNVGATALSITAFSITTPSIIKNAASRTMTLSIMDGALDTVMLVVVMLSVN